MSNILSAFRQTLLDDAAVFALVSSRIYPLVLPQQVTNPCLLLNLISDRPFDTMAGEAGLFSAEVQVDAFAETPLAVFQLAEKVRLCLQGFVGTKLSVTIAGVHIENSMSDFLPEVVDYRQILTFLAFYYRESPS